jgi:hypothetical protein
VLVALEQPIKVMLGVLVLATLIIQPVAAEAQARSEKVRHLPQQTVAQAVSELQLQLQVLPFITQEAAAVAQKQTLVQEETAEAELVQLVLLEQPELRIPAAVQEQAELRAIILRRTEVQEL